MAEINNSDTGLQEDSLEGVEDQNSDDLQKEAARQALDVEEPILEAARIAEENKKYEEKALEAAREELQEIEKADGLQEAQKKEIQKETDELLGHSDIPKRK